MQGQQMMGDRLWSRLCSGGSAGLHSSVLIALVGLAFGLSACGTQDAGAGQTPVPIDDVVDDGSQEADAEQEDDAQRDTGPMDPDASDASATEDSGPDARVDPVDPDAVIDGDTEDADGEDVQGSDADDGDTQDSPDATPDASSVCGNGRVEAGEECDDGNDSNEDACTNDCLEATCGDGFVWQGVELCDTGIPEGELGSCPTSCPSADACTPQELVGSACLSNCVPSPITACADGDGCCPEGCNATNDDDCAPVCGNGVVEEGETCDSAIPEGQPGACPMTCVSSGACTLAEFEGELDACTLTCTTTPIEACVDGDGCCPVGCDNNVDDDCSASCGNGVVEEGETCDPPETCPTSCDDEDACTINLLTGSASNCNAECTFPPLLACVDGDGCCPESCNANNDDDCDPVCGNGVVEDGEECDDGNVAPGDGCSATCEIEIQPTIFRVNALALRDPHVFVDVPIFGCRDLTNDGLPFGLAPSINDQLNTSITTDGNDDGFLDLSFLTLFRPLDLTGDDPLPFEFAEGRCTAPMETTTCEVAESGFVEETTYTVRPRTDPGTCLVPIEGTTRASYTPAIVSPTATGTSACFATAETTVSIDVSGVVIPLESARVGANFVGTPPATLSNGLVYGFLAEEVADALLLPDSVPVVGGQALSSILRGGTDNCASGSDLDVGPDGVTPGWWFYLNFIGARVP